MDIFTILHTASQIYEVSGGIKERDPYGIIIPITSLTIVFIALIVLFLSYELIGRASPQCTMAEPGANHSP